MAEAVWPSGPDGGGKQNESSEEGLSPMETLLPNTVTDDIGIFPLIINLWFQDTCDYL